MEPRAIRTLESLCKAQNGLYTFSCQTNCVQWQKKSTSDKRVEYLSVRLVVIDHIALEREAGDLMVINDNYYLLSKRLVIRVTRYQSLHSSLLIVSTQFRWGCGHILCTDCSAARHRKYPLSPIIFVAILVIYYPQSFYSPIRFTLGNLEFI